MSGSFSFEFNDDFGPLYILSGRSPDSMQILAYSPTQKLLWDYGSTEGFYVYIQAPDDGPGMYALSPSGARNWFVTTPVKIVLYNPFLTPIVPRSLSTII